MIKMKLLDDKVLDYKIKNFNTVLEKLLSKRKNNLQLSSNLVLKIIRDVKKNGDKALLKPMREDLIKTKLLLQHLDCKEANLSPVTSNPS